MTTAEQEKCHRCGHQRMHHQPNCRFKDCTCIGFSKLSRDPASVREEVDGYLDKAVLALREAFSSDQDIEREMHAAVNRVMRLGREN